MAQQPFICTACKLFRDNIMDFSKTKVDKNKVSLWLHFTVPALGREQRYCYFTWLWCSKTKQTCSETSTITCWVCFLISSLVSQLNWHLKLFKRKKKKKTKPQSVINWNEACKLVFWDSNRHISACVRTHKKVEVWTEAAETPAGGNICSDKRIDTVKCLWSSHAEKRRVCVWEREFFYVAFLWQNKDISAMCTLST